MSKYIDYKVETWIRVKFNEIALVSMIILYLYLIITNINLSDKGGDIITQSIDL